jgi:twitching motility protein PilU
VALLDVLLEAAVATNASDIYLLEGVPPALKVDGVVAPVDDGGDPVDAATMAEMLARLLPGASRKAFEQTGEANLSFMHPEHGRFRVNCYRAMGASGAVLRRVKTDVPTIALLELPPLLGTLALERQGLLVVVGATGAGKSTTVAAMLDHRNASAGGHIVTIEDPVEFIHAPKQSILSQREVGIDTESYLVGLRNALRQAPDVIFVGELRDAETVAVALHSAETGHLVLSTLHATNATTAVERLLHFFPPEVRASTLLQLSLTLRAVIAQRLVPRADEKGRVAAMEIMLVTPRVQSLIRRGELEVIRQAIEEGTNEGLQTFDQGLLDLFQRKAITQDEALRFADSPNNLRLRMKGIR